MVSFSTVNLTLARGVPVAVGSARPLPAVVPLFSSLTSLWIVMEPVLLVSRSTSEGARSIVAARPKAGAAWVAEVAWSCSGPVGDSARGCDDRVLRV